MEEARELERIVEDTTEDNLRLRNDIKIWSDELRKLLPAPKVQGQKGLSVRASGLEVVGFRAAQRHGKGLGLGRPWHVNRSRKLKRGHGGTRKASKWASSCISRGESMASS